MAKKRITINKAIDRYHDSKVKQFTIIDDITETNILEEDLNQYSLDYILKLIQELPNRYRLVFNLYELDDFSHKEIAKMLQISEGTSKSNLHRAKLILKGKLTQKNKKSYG